MGGQACVFYGAAEFSRDLDLLLLADEENLARLRTALRSLDARPIAVPSLDAAHLARGHAVHFRCQRTDVAGLRIDLMSALRGVAGFEELWARRTTIEFEGETIDLLALPDLVLAKKTQRDKDWPMIRRLVEGSYLSGAPEPEAFWLSELRTPELLIEAARRFPDAARAAAAGRPAVAEALRGDTAAAARAIDEEERQERARDREWWEPLRREMEQMRRDRLPG